MKEEKKFLCPKIHPADLDLSKEWFVWYYEPAFNGSAHRRIKVARGINRLKTVEERLRFAEKLILDIQSGTLIPKKEKRKSILMEVVLSKKNSCSVKTIAANTHHLQEFLKFLDGKSEMNVTKQDAEDFQNFLFTKNLTNKTIKNYIQSLKAIYNRYIDFNEFKNFRNPFARLTPIRTFSRSKMWFNDQQINLIKNHCLKNDKRLWLACQFQYYCFIRPNELRQLKVENINLNAGYIEIPGEISKNNKTQKVSIPNPFYSELLFIEKMKPNQYIFSSKKNQYIGRNTMSKLHREMLKEIGICGNYAFYSWKHTGVVKAVKAGIHIKDLQLQLRHSSLDMVNEYLKNLGILDLDRIKNLFPEI